MKWVAYVPCEPSGTHIELSIPREEVESIKTLPWPSHPGLQLLEIVASQPFTVKYSFDTWQGELLHGLGFHMWRLKSSGTIEARPVEGEA